MSQIAPTAKHKTGVADPNIHASSRSGKQPESLMARKFLNASDDDDVWRPNMELIRENMAKERAGKEMYFFYGSLMDPATLQRVLGLQERPHLRPAYIEGYKTKLWGPYPALLDGPTGNIVRGMACEIEGGEDKDRLAAYETENYGIKHCFIEFDDGTRAIGKTFWWVGDKFELKDGEFSLKDWQIDNMVNSIDR